MKCSTFLFSLILSLVVSGLQAQNLDDETQFEGLRLVSAAHQLAVHGYAAQDPLYLITAAQTLAAYPVAGLLKPDSIYLEGADVSPFKAGAKNIQLDPYVLLNDAVGMANADPVVLAMIERTRNIVDEYKEKPRGRKFSPLVQEYLLESDGKVKLWTTFNGNEIAEVFLMGNGSTLIDLYLYDDEGNLVASDIKHIDNCYVSFTPSSTVQFRIEIRNAGSNANHCLLMTN